MPYYRISPANSSPSASPASSISSLYHISPTSPHRYSDASTASCAFPSWPRRSSLSGSAQNSSSSSRNANNTTAGGAWASAEVTNYVTDDDLFPDVFEDSESDCTPIASPCRSPQAFSMREAEVKATVTMASLTGKLVEVRETETHKSRKGKRTSSGRKKSSVAMSPILEGGE